MRLAIGHRVEQEPDFVTVVVLQGLQVWKQSTFRRCRGEPGNVAKDKLDHPISVRVPQDPHGVVGRGEDFLLLLMGSCSRGLRPSGSVL